MTRFERLLREVVPPLMRRWQVPGVAVGVSWRGARTLCGFGVDGREPAGPGTVWPVGSVADVFMADLVSRLAEAGRLGLDDRAAGLLPGGGLDPRITVRHLLTHSSGLPSDLGRAGNGLAGRLEFAPGSEFSRSRAGLRAAAAVVAAVRERPYFDALCGDLLRPAGMASTRPAGCDGVSSSVDDLIGYAELVLAGDVPAVVLTPQRSRGTDRQHAGLGWNLDQAGPDLVAWQCGRSGRYRARITVVPSRRLAYVVLTNAPHGEVVHRHLSDELLWTVAGPAGPADLPRRYEADLDELVGVFDAGAGGLVTLRPGLLPGELELDVDRRGGAAYEAGWGPVPADRVVPFSAQELLVLGPAEMHGTFIGLARDDDGRVTGLRIGGRLAPRVGPRVGLLAVS